MPRTPAAPYSLDAIAHLRFQYFLHFLRRWRTRADRGKYQSAPANGDSKIVSIPSSPIMQCERFNTSSPAKCGDRASAARHRSANRVRGEIQNSQVTHLVARRQFAHQRAVHVTPTPAKSVESCERVADEESSRMPSGPGDVKLKSRSRRCGRSGADDAFVSCQPQTALCERKLSESAHRRSGK